MNEKLAREEHECMSGPVGVTADSVSDKSVLEYPIHPAANAYPLLAGQTFDEFVEGVHDLGRIEEPVVFYEGKLLEGRNRLRAVEAIRNRHGVVIPWERKDFAPKDGDTPEAFVKRRNGERRHLTEDQKAAAIVWLEWIGLTEEAFKRKQKSHFGSSRDTAVASEADEEPKQSRQKRRNPTTAEILADKGGTSRYLVEQAIKVWKGGGIEAIQEVIQGRRSLAQAVAAIGASKGGPLKEATSTPSKSRPKKVPSLETRVERLWESIQKKFDVAELHKVVEELARRVEPLDKEPTSAGIKAEKTRLRLRDGVRFGSEHSGKEAKEAIHA